MSSTQRRYCKVYLLTLPNRRIKDYCEQKGLFYIPVSENVTDMDSLIDTCHLSDNGIAFKANIVLQYIRDYIAPALDSLPIEP
jgi:hypothetical protein